MIIQRNISNKIFYMLKKYPIVTLTGVRQCGKTTLLRNLFQDYKYISLEDTDVKLIAQSDPRGFLTNCGSRVILDEVQRALELFPYIQTITDETTTPGQYILSGSHNFSLMQSITQSLAGRSSILRLAPYSISELTNAAMSYSDPDELMVKGFYPRTYAYDIDPGDFYPSYMDTYIERDVRLISNISDANLFRRFLLLCASRVGSVLNLSDLARDTGISTVTAGKWISILEQSYIIYMLPPYYKNFSKRIIKSPKLYFMDTGLLCYLLRIETAQQLKEHSSRGAVFENLMIMDYLKNRFFQGKDPNAYFWRDTNGNEIDLITETEGRINAYEIKSGNTMNIKYFNTMHKIRESAGLTPDRMNCIYTGSTSIQTKDGNFLRYSDAF